MNTALIFDAASHTYRLDGRPIPSVTRALGVLDDWEHVPRDRLEAARRFGDHVHKAVALLVRGQLDWARLDPQLVPYVEGAQRFLRQARLVVLASELAVVNRAVGYAGMIDLVAREKYLGIYDFKSGALTRMVGPQTAGYAEAYRAMYNARVQRRYCVQLSPELPNGYRVHLLTDPADWNIFLSALNITRWKNGTSAAGFKNFLTG